MEEIVVTKWNGDMSFDSNIEGFTFTMDTSEDSGGKNKGPRPKPMLLSALAGCAGMDIVSILAKMKVEIKKFSIQATGDAVEEQPKHYQKIHLLYEFRGKELPLDKIEKAINLSQDRYCPVFKMLSKVAEITWEVKLDEEN